MGNYNNNQERIFNLARNDGSIVRLTEQEPVGLLVNKEETSVQKFDVNGNRVFAHIDMHQLENNPQYRDAIANMLFSEQRMEKIMNQYCGYAGGIYVDKNGNVAQDQKGKYKFLDSNVLDAIEYMVECEKKALATKLVSPNSKPYQMPIINSGPNRGRQYLDRSDR